MAVVGGTNNTFRFGETSFCFDISFDLLIKTSSIALCFCTQNQLDNLFLMTPPLGRLQKLIRIIGSNRNKDKK